MSLTAAYIVPHPPLAVAEVGRGEEANISATLDAYYEVAARIAAHEPDLIIFISPHTAYYADWVFIAPGTRAQGSFAQFGASQVSFEVEYDEATRESIDAIALKRRIPAGTVGSAAKELDHGVLVPLYFIAQELPLDSFKTISIGGSALPDNVLTEFGRCIATAAHEYEGKAVLVVSGDLSHKLKKDGPYGFNPAGPFFDRSFEEIIRSGDLSDFADIDPQVREDAAECGLSGFIMLSGTIDEAKKLQDVDFTSELLSLEGPFGVGYGIAAFEQKECDDE